MANIAPPAKTKKAKTTEKKSMPRPVGATEQTPPDTIKPLQLKIPETAKNEFKAYAAMRGKSMNALFLEMFDEHKSKHA